MSFLTDNDGIAIVFLYLILALALIGIALLRWAGKRRAERARKKREGDELVQAMVDNFDEVTRARHQALLKEYWELTDRAIAQGYLQSEDSDRLGAVHAELRKVPGLKWRRPK